MKITEDIAREHGYDTLSDYDLHERYDESLDDSYGEVKIAGGSYSTSHALKEVDPTAYDCGFNDWLDSECRDGNVKELDDGEYIDESKYNDLLDELQQEIDAKEEEE